MRGALSRAVGRRAGGLAALALVLALVLAVVGCGQPRRGPSLPVQARASRIDVFLEAYTGVARGVVVDIAGLWLVDADGGRHPLGVDVSRLAADQLPGRQAIAGGVVPPLTYVALEVELVSARREQDGLSRRLPLLGFGEEPPEVPPLEPDDVARVLAVPVRVEVGRHDAVSLFLQWDVDASLLPGDWFRLALGVDLETPRARLGLLYVSDGASGSVLALDRSNGRITATMKVGDGPAALDLVRNRRQLLVANAGDGSMSLVDTREEVTLFTLPVRFGASPEDVVEAAPGRLAAVANPGTDTVSILDLANVSKLRDVRVGRRPTRLAAAPVLRRLYVVNSLSDDLSVIDINALDVVATLGVESMPSAVAVDRREREVYVVHQRSPDMLVYDAASLALLETIWVGPDVTAVLPDRRRDRIYLARAAPPELVVVDRRLSAVIRRTPLSGPVVNLAQPPEGPSVYGASPEQGGIVVVDVITGREQPLLPCGTAPNDVAVVD